MAPHFIKNITHCCHIAIIGATIALTQLTGCVSDSCVPDSSGVIDQPVEVNKGRVTLDLSIGINNGKNSGTRAFNPEKDGTFEDPISEYEKVHTLRVVIVRHAEVEGSNLKQSIIEHNRMVTVSGDYNDEIDNRYIINDNLQFNVVANEMKTIYLFANEKGAKLNSTADDNFDFTTDLAVGKVFPAEKVNNLLITRKPDAAFIDNGTTIPVADKSYIPMSECFEVIVPAATGNVEDFYSQSLFLTRSLIKFSFSIILKEGDMSLEEIKNYGMKVIGVKISNLADASYFLPRDTEYNPSKYFDGKNYFDLGLTSSTTNPDRSITSFSVPDQLGFSDCTFMFDKPIEITKEGQFTSPLIYLPESKNNNGYLLTLLFDNDELNSLYTPKPLTFHLNDIRQNTTDIPRNTHVKINIAILLNRQPLDATVTVFPYTGVILNPEFGFIIPVESIELSIASKDEPVTQWECREGEEFNMIASVLPINANNKDLVWESSDETIATVTSFGLVNGVKQGTAVITVKSVDNPEATASCTVTVKPKIPVTGLSLSPSTWRDNIGESIRLTADLLPTDATIQDIIWESSNNDIATVSSYGIVTAVSPGNAVITAKAADNPSISATCTVTVNPKVHVTSISISAGPSGTFYEGNQFSLAATVSPANATDKGITWTSSDNDVATVTSYGLVTAKSPGTTTITATSTDDPSKSASRTITVTAKIPVTGITLTKSGQTVTSWTTPVGESIDVRATIEPLNATYGGIVWQSSDVTVATLKHITTGNHTSVYYVNAIGKGTATITASSYDNPDVKVEYKVTVN